MKTRASLFMTMFTAFALVACGSDDTTDPNGNGGNGGNGGGGGGNGAEPAAIAVASGGNQSAKTEQELASPLVVSVTDADGGAVSGVAVSWSVTDGPGSVSPTSASTDAQGQASASFTGGTSLGTSTIRATVSGVSEAAEFTIETSTLVIDMANIAFVGPNGTDDVTIPLGATVEWQNLDQEQHTVTSTDTPTDGASFDSELLGNGETFTFTPGVEGTWTYFCQVHPTLMQGATITVTDATSSSTGSGEPDDSPPGSGDPYDQGG